VFEEVLGEGTGHLALILDLWCFCVENVNKRSYIVEQLLKNGDLVKLCGEEPIGTYHVPDRNCLRLVLR